MFTITIVTLVADFRGLAVAVAYAMKLRHGS